MFNAFGAKDDDSWMHEPVDDIDMWAVVNDNFVMEVRAGLEAIHSALLCPDVPVVEGLRAA